MSRKECRGEFEKLLTAEDVGAKLQVKPTTVYGWVHRAIGIPFIKIEGTRTIRFNPASVDEWVRNQEIDRRRKNLDD
jgi:excisionase family DNA binding protein